MGYRYKRLYGDNYVRTGTAHWIDENKIIGTSQPFIQVSFYVHKEAHDADFVSDFYKSEDDQRRPLLILPRNYITSAEFDGVQIGARKGKISVIDPEGIWARCMNFIGKWKTEFAGVPNMVIHFGWVGLGGNKSQNLQEIPSVLLRTAFGMNEDGVITIDLEFIESSEKVLQSIKFNLLDDLNLLNSEINQELKGKKIHEILRYMCGDYGPEDANEEAQSEAIAAQLERFKVNLSFMPTYEDDEHAYGQDSEDIKIRIGDTLGSKINELITRTMPWDRDENSEYNYSYEMIRKDVHKIEDGEVAYGTTITYGWRQSRKPSDSGDSLTSEDTRETMSTGGEKPMIGPRLLWKKQSSNSDEKTLISFDIDLKMLDYATSLMRSELDKKLSSFSESDWSDVAEAINMMDEDKKAELLTMTPQQLSDAYQNGGGAPDVTWDGPDGALWWKSHSDEDSERISQVVEEFMEVLRSAQTNTESQIQTIIRNNLFKAKARIMGDPTFGTIYTMFKVGFDTDFSSVGDFASYFNRFWKLTKVSHKIDDTGYFTDLELMAEPNDTI